MAGSTRWSFRRIAAIENFRHRQRQQGGNSLGDLDEALNVHGTRLVVSGPIFKKSPAVLTVMLHG